MDHKVLISFGFVIFASLSTQLIGVLFRHNSKITGSDLADQHPEFAWITLGYPISIIIWFLIIGLLPIYLIISSPPDSFVPFQVILFILGGAIGSVSILHGLFGFLTSVFPIPHKRSRLYVFDENNETIALILIAMGIFMIIIALASICFYLL